MLINYTQLLQTKILSLHSGGPIGTVEAPIVSPESLSIVGFTVKTNLLQGTIFLRAEEIREIGDLGIIIDSIEELTAYGDVPKLDEIYDLNFNPCKMPVTDEKRHRIGVVRGYTLDAFSLAIQQIAVKRPLIHSFKDTELLVHRSQIIEINNTSIVIKSKIENPHKNIAHSPGSYVNPFRSTKPAQQQNTNTR